MVKTKICNKCKIEKSISDFHKCKSYPGGLHYYCKECRCSYERKLKLSNPNYKKKSLNRSLLYQKQYPDKANKSNKKYRDSEKGKEWRINYRKLHKEYYREVNRKYAHSSKGRIIGSRCAAKRYRELGFLPLFLNPFPEEIEVHYHHINDLIVIPVPKKLHESTYFTDHRERMEKIIKMLYGDLGLYDW